MHEHKSISKNVSILYRLGQPFFDRVLSPYHIGAGQQFFLLRIYEHPGISLLELSGIGHFDKGTTTRAVKKLEEEGYINRTIDPKDKRMHYLSVSEKAETIVKATREAIHQWHAILTDGMNEEEKREISNLLDRMSENAFSFMKKNGR